LWENGTEVVQKRLRFEFFRPGEQQFANLMRTIAVNDSTSKVSSEALIAALGAPKAYPASVQGIAAAAGTADAANSVCQLETHISWVFLIGDCAYKVKKPVSTPFLDYRTLADRKHYCEEELRLDRRFAPDLYLGVVPITLENDQVCVEGSGEPIEYAVKMKRFAGDALLIERLKAGLVTTAEIIELARTVGAFHDQAKRQPVWSAGTPERILANAVDNLSALQPWVITEPAASLLRSLQLWTRDTFEELEPKVAARLTAGFIRECHGDLHLGNIVMWGDRLLPFDGIDFNEDFRVIDVLSDIAFLTMDLAAHNRHDLRFLFRNAYVEQHGDRASLELLRWYEVYRALVRGKVASLRAQQLAASGGNVAEADADRDRHIALAHALSSAPAPTLTITHGLSGSGKSTYSERLVARSGAIRVRADVERKRLHGLQPSDRVEGAKRAELYSDDATQATYLHLYTVAEELLVSGYSVVLDATFLQQKHRRTMHELADRLGVDFAILDCAADPETLSQRMHNRQANELEPSDADASVLEAQLVSREPLTDSERALVMLPLPRSGSC